MRDALGRADASRQLPRRGSEVLGGDVDADIDELDAEIDELDEDVEERLADIGYLE